MLRSLALTFALLGSTFTATHVAAQAAEAPPETATSLGTTAPQNGTIPVPPTDEVGTSSVDAAPTGEPPTPAATTHPGPPSNAGTTSNVAAPIPAPPAVVRPHAPPRRPLLDEIPGIPEEDVRERDELYMLHATLGAVAGVGIGFGQALFITSLFTGLAENRFDEVAGVLTIFLGTVTVPFGAALGALVGGNMVGGADGSIWLGFAGGMIGVTGIVLALFATEAELDEGDEVGPIFGIGMLATAGLSALFYSMSVSTPGHDYNAERPSILPTVAVLPGGGASVGAVGQF